MIELHSVSGNLFYLNCDLIYQIEDNYDTVITLTNDRKLLVKESPEEIVNKIIAFKRQIFNKWREE